MKKNKISLSLKEIKNIESILLNSLDFHTVVKSIVDKILQELASMNLGYRIVVLTLVNKRDRVLERVSLTQTPEAKAALSLLMKERNIAFNEIKIPLTYRKNASIKALTTGKWQSVTDFSQILSPALSIENAQAAQLAAGIKSSIVFPIKVQDKTLGTMIYSKIRPVDTIDSSEIELLDYFTGLVGLALQNSRLYSSIDRRTKELASANKKLLVLDKQKDEFISIASHELKTPISIVKTNLWMLRHISEKTFDTKQWHFMKEIDLGVERLAKIVNNLLDISRIEQGRFVIEEELHDIDLIIHAAVESFVDMAAKKNLKILEPKNKVGSIYVDKDRFIEVLDNFLSNAIKYTEKGGIKVNIWDKKSHIKVAVTDTGPGISANEIKRLFKKFSRAKEGLKQHSVGASTGLGLYISKRIIEEMGGEIGVVSKVGKGSTFWFTVPKGKKVYKDTESVLKREKIKQTLLNNRL